MPHFYFHLLGRTVERDENGTELPSAGYAKREGTRLVGSLLTEGILEKHGGTIMLEIMDETGAVLFQVDVTSWNAPVTTAA